MKTIILYYSLGIACALAVPVEWSDEERRLETEQVAVWETNIEQAKLKPKKAIFEDLWLGFRKMGHRRTWDGHNPKVDDIYITLQNMFLTIPGHAEYFRDEIEKKRAALKPDQFRGSYDDDRRLYFEAISHLPSPETIKVLGEYLSDERDAAKEAIWEPVDFFLIGVEPNSDHAREALKKIGLRNTSIAEPDVGEWPSPTSYSTREEYMRVRFSYLVALREARLKPWLAWYAEVKEGKRTFSFKGQNVEYRFKPDGTWETIPLANPPDDGPKPTKPVDPAIERPEKRASSAAAVEQVVPSRVMNWVWPVFLTLALLIGVICIHIRKSKKSV